MLLEYLRDLVQARYFFDPIEEVVFEPAAVPTFDVVMPETHSFWANGFLSHNTTPSTPKRTVTGPRLSRSAWTTMTEKEDLGAMGSPLLRGGEGQPDPPYSPVSC